MASGLVSFTDGMSFATAGTVSSAGDLTLTATTSGGTITVKRRQYRASASGQNRHLAIGCQLTLPSPVRGVSAGATGTVINRAGERRRLLQYYY